MYSTLVNPLKETIKEKRHVPILHIDADEEHVSLQNGKPKKTMIPVICVFEGIKHEGTRGMCVNPFYILDSKIHADNIWERVTYELDKRYDLSGTKIYIHGDGENGLDVVKNGSLKVYLC